MQNDLISRSVLIEAMHSVTSDTTCPMHIAAEIDQLLDCAPAVDAVEVVRCKECKHCDKEPDEREGCCFGIADGTMLTDPDEFCSRGERRADDGK